MKKILSLALMLGSLFAEDFISEFEYGQMLYKDPRGVSCASCHGKVGEGSYIASFIDKEGKKHDFSAPDIRDLTLEGFKKAILSGGKIMPKYYLTNKESEAIYKYIQVVNNYNDSNKTDEDEAIDENITLEDDNQTEDKNKSQGSIISKIFKLDEEQ